MRIIIKSIQKILSALFLLLGTVLVATGVYCYYYQDQIIQKFIDEANKRLSNPIQMRSIQFTFLKSFPNIVLILHDVVVKNSIATEADLLTARKIYCALDVWNFIQGQYVLSHLDLEHGKLCLEQYPEHQLGREQDTPKTAQQKGSWMVQQIHLKDIEIVHSSKQHHCSISAVQMQASLRWRNDKLEADLQGETIIQRIQLKDVSFVQSLPISLKTSLNYDQRQKTWTVQSAQLKHGQSLLAVQGRGGLEAASAVALTIQGKKINPQTLLCCLPQQYYQKIQPYNLHGEITLHANVNKQPHKSFALQGDFALSDGALTTSQLSKPLELRQLLGHFHIPDVQDLQTAILSIDKMTMVLVGSRLEGNLALYNFRDLQLKCAAEGTLDLASLGMLFARHVITDASGKLNLRWELEANLQRLMCGDHAKDNFRLSGILRTQETAQFKLGTYQLPYKDLIGNLAFQDNALVIKNLSGSVGPGNFALTGTIQNILPCALLNNQNNQKLCADARIYMDYLDLDAVLHGKHAFAASASPDPLKFAIAPHWVLNLDCDIQQLHFRRFRGKNVRGTIKARDQQLIAEKLQLGVAGGKVFLDGVLDASTDLLNIHTVTKIKGVQIATLFYTFENFHQHFLMDSHLGGEVFADVDLTMQADKLWNMRWDALQAAIDFRLINGALHDFKPIQQLAKYVDKESLSNLRFSALKSHISIKDKTIYLSPMEVHSNLTRIQLSGTHTFGGKIAYQFGIPFTGLQQQARAQAPTAAATDSPENINLFFKLQGDIDNYKIIYDAKASSKSLAKGFKEEGKKLKALLQGIYRQRPRIQALAPEDYFELDE
jgi:AsmA-like C-terminal region